MVKLCLLLTVTVILSTSVASAQARRSSEREIRVTNRIAPCAVSSKGSDVARASLKRTFQSPEAGLRNRRSAEDSVGCGAEAEI